jgi:Tol biopolymer transport system component
MMMIRVFKRHLLLLDGKQKRITIMTKIKSLFFFPFFALSLVSCVGPQPSNAFATNVVETIVSEQTAVAPSATPALVPTPIGGGSGIIAFTLKEDQYAPGNLFYINIEHGDMVQLTNNPENEWTSGFSPDGSKLIFSTDEYAIRSLPLSDPKMAYRISAIYQHSVISPIWMPDYEHIALIKADEIWTFKEQGGDWQQLTFDGVRKYSLKLSPDGQQFAYKSITEDGFSINIMDVDGNNLRQLTTARGFLDWSPDGKTLVYSAIDTKDGVGYGDDLFLIDLATGGITQLTDDRLSDTFPAFSPDGQWIAFSHSNGRADDIFIISVDGTETRQITELDYGMVAHSPVWQPFSDSHPLPLNQP